MASFLFYGGASLGLCAGALVVTWLSDYVVRS